MQLICEETSLGLHSSDSELDGDVPLILMQALLATSATRKHKKKKKKVCVWST